MTFHVPEEHRVKNGVMGSSIEAGNNGAFVIPFPEHLLAIIASDGLGWEHVSVHVQVGKRSRTPSWSQMCLVKDLFWDPEDVVIQFHPRKSEYRNLHVDTLHLWRPIGVELPTPHPITVAP